MYLERGHYGLERIDGVQVAEVDHSGELLRLLLTDRNAVVGVRDAMRELGYEASDGATVPMSARWFSSGTVRELSHEEAGIIAGRVVQAFLRTREAVDDPERLRELVASALYGTFRAHMISGAVVPGALHEEAVRAVIGAMSSVIGPDAARELGAALERDLDRATS